MREGCIVLIAISAASSLGGCSSFGLFVPEMQEFYQDRVDERIDENTIVNQVKCELHKGVQDTLRDYSPGGIYYGAGNSVDWLRKWAAKVTMKLTVDEKSGLNPGISYFKPLANAVAVFPGGGSVTNSRSFTLGAGLQASADATRQETLGFTYAFKDLLSEPPIEGPCDNENGILIHSDLKIGQFITNKAFIAKIPGSVSGKKGASPFNIFNYEATFIVVYGGNVTPTWKFTRITADPSSPFFNASRSRTHDVTITMGPAETNPSGGPQVSQEAQAVHNAALIGQAVAVGTQSQQH